MSSKWKAFNPDDINTYPSGERVYCLIADSDQEVFEAHWNMHDDCHDFWVHEMSEYWRDKVEQYIIIPEPKEL